MPRAAGRGQQGVVPWVQMGFSNARRKTSRGLLCNTVQGIRLTVLSYTLKHANRVKSCVRARVCVCVCAFTTVKKQKQGPRRCHALPRLMNQVLGLELGLATSRSPAFLLRLAISPGPDCCCMLNTLSEEWSLVMIALEQ